MIRIGLRVPASRAFLRAALRGLVAVNRDYLSRRRYPRLYESKVRYRRERRGRGPEEWQTVAQLFSSGEGDCEDLAAARVAELQESGEPAEVDVVRTGKKRFHALVVRGDGRVEDPSKILRR